VAELVVLGTTGERKIKVREVLFGRPSGELIGAQRVVPLGRTPVAPSGRSGVWFLVRGPDGYALLNPDCKPVSLEVFKQLPRPTNHWTARKNLIANRHTDVLLYYSYTKPDTKERIPHGTRVDRYGNGTLWVELELDGRRELFFRIDSAGSRDRIGKGPAKGYGFYLEYHEGHLVEFSHCRNGKRHGLHRRYFRENPRQLREEKHFTDGVIDGRCREWDENGKVISDVVFKRGLIPPIVHYKGKGRSGVILHRDEYGATYSGAPMVVGAVKVGMTTQQVSDLLKVDFSPVQGLFFPTYYIDMYLSIGFSDGKVSEIRTGHNGVCVGLDP